MKERINQINLSIEEKKNRLKEKVERYFATITIPSSCVTQQSKAAKKTGKIPPISYVLYAIAGLSIVKVFTSDFEMSDSEIFDSEILYLGIAAASALGGYTLSKRTSKISTSSTNVDIESLKNDVVSKVVDSIRKLTHEWDEFMELKQREIQSVILTSSNTDTDKDSMMSKVFIYEVVDISLSEFSSVVSSTTSLSELKGQLNAYKTKLLSAIDTAVMKQINKYSSILSNC